MSGPTDPTYPARVISAAKAEVRRCCVALPAAEDDRDRVVQLQVETAVELAEHDRTVLRSDVDRVALRLDERIRVQTLLLPSDPALADEPPHYAVKASLREQPPLPAPDEPKARLSERELLTLSCGGLTLSYLLTPSPRWIPLRRQQDGVDHRTEIVVPAGLRGVPREALVELRLHDDELRVRRTDALPEVRVLVDDRPVTERPLPGTGRLSVVDGDQRTELRWALAPWRDRPLVRGTGRAVPTADPDDGEAAGADQPYEAAFRVGARRGRLAIAPPSPGTAPRERGFRVAAPDFEGGFMAVPAEVLYTDATSTGDDLDGRRWHVKLFRTATPQHAGFLRGEFARQAEAIREVIVGAGGSLARPPWGIAPVHVLDPTWDAQDSQPTRIGAPAEPGPVDARFGDWFGVPGGAMSDCFVVVASPLLEPTAVEREPAGPALLHLARFRVMAQALDACHRHGIAHCDLKPDNYRKQGPDYVLIDGDSVTELSAQPVLLPFTPPYAAAEQLRRHPPYGSGGPVLRGEEIIAHDRFGFGLLVLGAVVGSGWVAESVQGAPGERVVDAPDRLRDALRLRWGRDPRWTELIALLAEPFDDRAVHAEGWTCEKWLSRVTVKAHAPMPVEAPRSTPDYDGPYAEAFAAVREEVTAQSPNPVRAMEVVDVAIRTAAGGVYARSRLRWALGVGAVCLLVLVLAALQLLQRTGWVGP